jgi:hypothetical protein
MILFENSILKLDYNPATDIMEVAYPDLQGYLLSEIKNSINILVDMVKNYDVKRLLLDSSKTVISVSEKESGEISRHLATGLMNTRLKKLARVQSPSSTVETTAQENMKHVQEALTLPFHLQSFSSKADAMEWLTKPL